MRTAPFYVTLSLSCACGAAFDGSISTRRISGAIRAFGLSHYHVRRNALGRFVKWQS